MSVTIYDGMRSTLADPFEFALRAREILAPIFFEKAEKAVRFLSENPNTELTEYFRLSGNRLFEPASDLGRTVLKAVEELRLSYVRTFSEFDFGYELILIPSNLPKSNPLVLIYSADKSYSSALLEAGILENYGYWDNTDIPEELTADQWLEREQAWGKLIEEEHTPASCGLSIGNPAPLEFDMWLIDKGIIL